MGFAAAGTRDGELEAGSDPTLTAERRELDDEAAKVNIDVTEEQQLDNAADERFMRRALELAQLGRQEGEVPVGAVVVIDGVVVGEGWNQPIGTHDPTAHAEVVAVRAAARHLGNYRLTGATLYVTIEPCQMCVGAMVHARVARVVFGATEPKSGAIESAMRAHEHPSLNHRLVAVGGVLEAECRAMLQAFFAARRASARM